MASLLSRSFHAPSNYCLVTKGFVTLETGKSLFSIVGPFMLLQLIFSIKSLVTLGTGKWLLSLVDPFLPLQIIV